VCVCVRVRVCVCVRARACVHVRVCACLFACGTGCSLSFCARAYLVGDRRRTDTHRCKE
jgi:hypothetical protein